MSAEAYRVWLSRNAVQWVALPDVPSPTALISGPATLVRYGREGFTLRVHRPGRIIVRVHATRYWQVTGAKACVTATPDDWSVVHSRSRGIVRVRAAISARRLLTGRRSCRA